MLFLQTPFGWTKVPGQFMNHVFDEYFVSLILVFNIKIRNLVLTHTHVR